MSPAPIILVEHLSKRFKSTVAVDGVGFAVERGATTALLGGNGAGKTTTLSMLLGLLLPSAGRIRVLGEDMLRHRHRVLPRMNFSSPYVDLPHRLTVRENLTVFGRLYGLRDVAGRIRAVSRDLQLDEPTASLDPDTGDWVRRYLEDYRARTGATILLASHNMGEVERLCSDVLMMRRGRIVDRGSPQALIDRHGRRNLEEVFLAIARGERTGAAPEPVP